MILTYKYRLKDKHTKKVLLRFAWACNQVWNFCCETQRKIQVIHRQGPSRRWPSHFELAGMAKGTSKELGINAQSVECACEQFVRSREQHGKCPRFRASSGPKRALGWIPFQQQSRQTEGNAITYLGKTFRWFGSKRRPLPAAAKGGAFVEDSLGRWWVTFQVEVQSDQQHGGGAVGVDLGLKHFATLSTGEKVESLRAYRTWEAKLATAQRAGNRARAKRIHVHVANVRRDALHKLSSRLVRENGLILVGNVNAAGLAKTRMSKSVLDAGWSTFRLMLRYKASRHGATYRDVDERFTTQTCSRCGDCASAGRPKGIAGLGIREWRCEACGAVLDRDHNAALNILALGRSVAPPVEESRRAA